MRLKNSFPGARAAMAAWLLAVWLPGAQASGAAPVVLGDSIKPVAVAPASGPVKLRRPYISRATLKAGEATAMMTFEVALKMRNFADLQARVDKGEHVSSQEMVAKYEPLATDYQAAVDWLTSEGFAIVRRDSHHMAIFVRGNVSQIARALKVNFARVTSEGKEYTSAVTAPSAPANIAPLLIGINGLQPHIHAHKRIVKPNAASADAGVSYTPSQIAQAYQATGLYNTGITGTGQTIAIVIDTFPAKSDLIAFWNGYGINQSINNIQFIQAVAGTLPAPSGEETLDTEWSSSIAPGAKVRVYAATDLGSTDLDTAYQQVYDDVTAHPELEIHQMSMSYGDGEIETTNSQMITDHHYFVELTNAGVTCFAATGDEGSTPGVDADGNPDEDGYLEVESPASDPYVIGVGGTSLTSYSSPNATTEVVWNDGASGGATGGGTSGYWPRPSWQTGTGIANGAYRLLPDISCAADPNYGADTIFAGTPGPTGGTSWSCPTCAAFCALMNEARANVGRAFIGQMGPLIYPLIGTANFRDITSGNNATAISGGLYSATTGYDECTGIGVPLVQSLAETLAGTQTLIGVNQPSAIQTVDQGQNATIAVTASGNLVSYQWQRMPIGATAWSDLSDNSVYSGSATASLTVTNTTTAMSGDQFQCVVTYAGTGALTSNQPTVLIVENPWNITTLAGEAGTTGTPSSSNFNYPTGIAIDNSGNLYVTDLDNNVIRKVTPRGVVTTPYGNLNGTAGSTSGTGNDGVGNSAYFCYPRDITIDGTSTHLYVSDEGSNQIRQITLATGQVSTINLSTTLSEPKGIVVDGSGNIYVADYGNNVIRKITSNGTVTTYAGSSTFAAGYANGAATTHALFNGPLGLAIDSLNNIYVTDFGNEAVRKITPQGVVSTVAGQAGVPGCLDGVGTTQALFNVPRGIVVDSSGNLYVTDSYTPIVTQNQPTFTGNDLLRKITPAGVVSTLAGQAGVAGSTDATGSAAQFYNPAGVALTASGTIYVADASNNTIRSAVAESVVSLSATQPYAAVNGPVAGQFTVTRTGSTLTSLTVNYLVGGTAVGNRDYSALPDLVTIPAGASSATIAVTPLSNSTATSNQTVTLTLMSSIAGVTINSTPATVTISEAKPVMFGAWEASFPNPLTGASAALLATPWNDGIPNLLKYVFDIDPSVPMTSADRAALPTVGAATIGETSYLTLTYREYAGLTGITVNAQTSPDLQTWTTVMNPTIFVTGIDPATGDPIMQVQVAGTSGFIRLSVVSP